MPMEPCRERRSWTAREDQLLREAVDREDPQNPNPSKWHAISKHVPNRTNKDCRKRWFAKMASDVVKGGWSPEEDERLMKGIKVFGTRWSQVASIVQTRNSDQCAKRWTDTLNPSIDRSMWTPDADRMLIEAVAEHGKVWTKIVKTYFPGRTGLSAKNRYNSITRYSSDHSRCRARRRTPESPQQFMHSRSHTASPTSTSSASSSCSTPSPLTPPISLMDRTEPHAFQLSMFDTLQGWQSSTMTPFGSSLGDGLSFNSQNHFHSRQPTSLKPDHVYGSFDRPLPQYGNPPLSLQEMFANQQTQSSIFSAGPQNPQQLCPQVPMTGNMSNQYVAPGAYQADFDPYMNLAWESAEMMTDTKPTLTGSDSSFIFPS